MSKIIELKGSILSLTVLKLHSDDIEETKQAIAHKVAQAPSFFAGIPVVLEPKVALQDPTYLALLVEFLHQKQMIPTGIRSEDATIIEQAKYAGLACFPLEKQSKANRKPKASTQSSETKQPEEKAAPIEVESAGLKTAMRVEASVRSGQQVFAKDRDLIVMGSVNPGAEVIADGSVHVFGKVLGKVFAGAAGETQAKIYAKQLNPELVCIAGAYQLAEDISEEYKQQFVEVSLKEDALVFNTKILD